MGHRLDVEGAVIAVRRRLWWAAGMLLLCAALALGYRLSGGFAQWVADGLSRPVGALLSGATVRVGVPLAELALILCALLLPVRLLRACVRAAQGRVGALRDFFERLLVAAAALLLSYALLWSAQLYAPKLEAPKGRSFGVEDLAAYCDELAAEANALSAAASDIDTVPENVKFARYPELMRALGMGGVYVPWTGETIVSELEPNLSLPFIAAHESAHAQGFAREDEANYIAYGTCMAGGVRSRYSGTMYALYYAMEALHDRDAARWNLALDAMNERVGRDYYRLNGLRTVQVKPPAPWRDAAVAAFGGGRGGGYLGVVDLLMADRC